MEVSSGDRLNFTVTVATDGDEEWAPGPYDGDASAEAIAEAPAQNGVPTAEYTTEAIADDDIDMDAFQVRIRVFLRPRGPADCSIFPVSPLSL